VSEKPALHVLPGPQCRVVACPLPIGWEFVLINDGNDTIDEATLYEIEYQWGDVSSEETVSGSTFSLGPGQAARLWHGTIEDELRMELLVRVRRGGCDDELRFAFPMLCRHRDDLQLISELGRKGWQVKAAT